MARRPKLGAGLVPSGDPPGRVSIRLLWEHAIANPGEIVKRYIAASPGLQTVAYLANEHKHAEIDPKKQRLGLDMAPRYGKPLVIG